MFNGSKALRERLDDLERKHKALEEDHEKLRRHVDLEWEELKDKVHRWMQRTGARDRAEAKAGVVRVVEQDTRPGTDPVSARILAQRGRMRAVPPPAAAFDEEGSEGNHG